DQPAPTLLAVLLVVVPVAVQVLLTVLAVPPQPILHRPDAVCSGVRGQGDLRAVPVVHAVDAHLTVEGLADRRGDRVGAGHPGAARPAEGVGDHVGGVEGGVPVPVGGVHAAQPTGEDLLDLLD